MELEIVSFVGGFILVLAFVFSFDAVGFSFYGSASWTSRGVSQMKIAPSSPTDTIYFWFGENNILVIAAEWPWPSALYLPSLYPQTLTVLSYPPVTKF